MRGILRRVGMCAVAGLVVLGAACSDGPSGPGAVTVSLTGDVPLGAAVLEIRGPGIQGVTLPAQGWVEWTPFREAGEEGVRVLAILDRPGDLALTVQLQDVAVPAPGVVVVEASDGADRPLAELGGIQARVGR